MTDEQYEKLPTLFKEIIDIHEQIEEAVEAKVITLDNWQKLHLRQVELLKTASQQYGKGAKSV